MSVIYYGKGIVWDNGANAPLVRFDKNGEAVVSDTETIKKLNAMGIRSNGELTKEPDNTQPPKPKGRPKQE